MPGLGGGHVHAVGLLVEVQLERHTGALGREIVYLLHIEVLLRRIPGGGPQRAFVHVGDIGHWWIGARNKQDLHWRVPGRRRLVGDLVGAQHLAAARFHGTDVFAGVAEVGRAHRAREQNSIDAVVDGDSMRIGRSDLYRLDWLVLGRVADDHRLCAHASQVPELAVVGENYVFADDASRYRHHFGDTVRRFFHVDNAQLGLAERRDISLGLVAVVENVVRDKVARQGDVLHDLAEILGRRIDVDDRNTLLARRSRNRRFERLQRIRRLRFVIDHCKDLAHGERRQRQRRGNKKRDRYFQHGNLLFGYVARRLSAS